jgi:hypothetical protein
LEPVADRQERDHGIGPSRNSEVVRLDPFVDRGTVVIARIWRGHTELRDAEEYLGLMRTVALPDYRSLPGNAGAYLLCRPGPTVVEFTTITFWSSEDEIRQFAGDDVTRARYYGFEAGFLLAQSPQVEHLKAYDR